MKSFIKYLIIVFVRIISSKWNIFNYISDKYSSFINYVYSQKYCQKFKCKNVGFRRNVNFTLGEKYFKIGNHTEFGKLVVLTAWDNYDGDSFAPKVTIGNNCNFGDYLHLTCINKISIGDNVLTGRWVTITDNSHGTSNEIINEIAPIKRKLYSKGPVIVEDNVWIGDKATILSGITIGKNSIIAANSVVTKDIPANSVAAGNPASIIKTLTAI